jgi:hypothetical protein
MAAVVVDVWPDGDWGCSGYHRYIGTYYQWLYPLGTGRELPSSAVSWEVEEKIG